MANQTGPGPVGDHADQGGTAGTDVSLFYQLRAVVAGELTKIVTVRSTWWCLLLTAVISIGLSFLLGLSFRNAVPDMPPDQRERFDPLFASFYALTMGQLALVVFAVLAVGGEYSSGTIRASLAAVPRRGLFLAGKILAVAVPVAGVALITAPGLFFVGQAGLGPYGVSLSADGAPVAIVGAALNLILFSLFVAGVAAMVRSSAVTLGVLLPLFFLGSQGLGNIPKVKVVTQYLPDQAGWVIMHISGPAGDALFGRDYGPWTGLGILALWAVAALLGGYLLLRHRDA